VKTSINPDANAKYFAEVVIDLDLVEEPMIADPDVNNADVSKDIRMIRLDHFLLRRSKKKLILVLLVLVWFTGDLKILSKMLQNIDEQYGK
jgi:aconitate hydratase 2/2-methylisocitrate dehydratase